MLIHSHGLLKFRMMSLRCWIGLHHIVMLLKSTHSFSLLWFSLRSLTSLPTTMWRCFLSPTTSISLPVYVLTFFLLSISSSHLYKCILACNGATAIFLVLHLKMFISIFICNGIECSTATFAASTLKPFAWIRWQLVPGRNNLRTHGTGSHRGAVYLIWLLIHWRLSLHCSLVQQA